MHSTVYHLGSYVADPEVFGARGMPAKTKVLRPEFWDQYDNSTLIYDALWLEKIGAVRLFLPKPLGFQPVLQTATWSVDGIAQKPKRKRQFNVYDTVDIPCPQFTDTLTMHTQATNHTLAINPTHHDRYAGRNVLYTQTKDDDLRWISDWVRAHQRNHGVDAVLIANNNSTTYSSEDLRQTLAQIDGLAAADVIDVPLRHGPLPGTATNIGRMKFQQRTLQNIARDRWLQKARAVLLCDVDELVRSVDGQSIFDNTVNSWLKFTRFAGAWRYRDLGDGAVTHDSHIFKNPAAKPCPSKYCIVPDSLLGRRSWAVHSLENINRRLFSASRKFHFYHCRSISTSWKNARSQAASAQLLEDPQTRAFMQSTFDRTLD